MKKITLIITLMFLFNILSLAQFDPNDTCPVLTESGAESVEQVGGRFKPASHNQNQYFRILIVFAQFSDETHQDPYWPLNQLPIYANNLIDQSPVSNYRPGTLSDYWKVLSHGNFDFIGDVYPQLVILPPTSYYIQQNKKVDEVNQDVFNLIDPYINYSLYDNWKLENGQFIFSPGNSDGYVDMIFICYRFPEDWFAPHYAWASLGWYYSWTFSTQDYNNQSINIKIRGEQASMSSISSGLTIKHALRDEYSLKQTMIHEFGHFLFGACHTTTGGIMGDAGNAARTLAMSGWESERLGYIPYIVANQNEFTVPLGDYITTGNVLKIPIPFSNPSSSTFFIVENHQRESMYDQIIRGGTLNGQWNFTTDLGKGIYIHYITNGNANCCSNAWRTADGSWNWVLDGTIQMPPGWPPEMPLTKRSAVNRNTGKSDRHHLNIFWNNDWWAKWHDVDPLTKEYTLTRDIMGDEYDAWNLGYNEIFSPWSNPSTYSVGNTNISVQLFSTYQNQITVKVFSTESSGLTLPPSKPQNLIVTINPQNYPVVTWDVNIEPDMPGGQYKIWRASTSGGEPTTFYHVGTINIPGSGAKPPSTYSWVDYGVCGVGQGAYKLFYIVTAVDNTSLESVRSNYDWVPWNMLMCKEGLQNAEEETITEYKLHNNYPNPFNPQTTIQYDVKEKGLVQLKVYDVLGKEVITLVSEFKETGSYSVLFDASELPSGIYIYSLRVNDFVQNNKMTLLK